jgi:chemotaxis family two-component system sensor histidine kinase/response regulator PixL
MTVATILIVEDAAAERDAIAQILRAGGHRVIEAVDGRDGLDQVHLRQPSLVLCDILMPERDGLEMIGALRSAGNKIPIIAMVEQDSPRVDLLRDLATGLGANAVLLKPVMVTELLETVAPLLA